MEIINIIVCSLNSVDSVKSFVITPTCNKKEIVKQAEKEFEKIAREKMGYDEDDDPSIETLIEDGYFNNGNLCVCICWSEDGRKKVTVAEMDAMNQAIEEDEAEDM